MSKYQIFSPVRYLCQKHGHTAETIACEWMAFVQKKPNAVLNEEMLDLLDREVRIDSLMLLNVYFYQGNISFKKFKHEIYMVQNNYNSVQEEYLEFICNMEKSQILAIIHIDNYCD